MSTDIQPHRPGLRSMLIMVLSEAKMVVRDSAGLIVPLGLPLLILLTSALAAGDEVIVNGRTALDLFVMPLVLIMVIATIGMINMPSFLAYYRRSGILRRLAVTPASPAMVLVAQAIVSIAQALLGMGLAIAVAAVFFGLNPPLHLWVAVGVVALVIVAFYGIGMIVAAVAPTPNSSVAIGLVVFFAFGALGGMFGGRQLLPEPLAEIGGWLPFGAAVDALGAAWAGASVDPVSLLSLGVTIVVSGLIAGLFFRWE